MSDTTSRYAVLWDVHGERSKPVGLAIDHNRHVHLYLPNEYGLGSRYTEPFRVFGPGGNDIIYSPGDEGYFEQVLIDLSRVFAIGEQGDLEQANDQREILHLFVRVVARTAIAVHRTGSYELVLPAARSFPLVAGFSSSGAAAPRRRVSAGRPVLPSAA